MWAFKGDPEHNQRFLIIGRGKPGMSEAHNRLQEARRLYFIEKGYEEHFIARGPLMTDDVKQWAGSAMMVELPDRAAVEAMLADNPHVRAGLYECIDVHLWRFGGRH